MVERYRGVHEMWRDACRDNEVKEEGFLEYINQLLMTGEVAGLLPKEELDAILNDVRPIFKRECIGVPCLYTHCKLWMTSVCIWLSDLAEISSLLLSVFQNEHFSVTELQDRLHAPEALFHVKPITHA